MNGWEIDHVEAHRRDLVEALDGCGERAGNDRALCVQGRTIGPREHLVPGAVEGALAIYVDRKRLGGSEMLANRVTLCEGRRQLHAFIGRQGRLAEVCEVACGQRRLDLRQKQCTFEKCELNLDAVRDLQPGVSEPRLDRVVPRLDRVRPPAHLVGKFQGMI